MSKIIHISLILLLNFFLSALARVCPQYQDSRAYVEVEFIGPNNQRKTLYLDSPPFSFTSSNTNVASITGSRIHGLSVGKSNISVSTFGLADFVEPSYLEVTNLPVKIDNLTVGVTTNAVFKENLSVNNDVNVIVELQQNLHKVFDRANITVLAHFNDSTFEDVGVMSDIYSLDSYISIVADSIGPQLRLDPGVSSMDKNAVLAAYKTCNNRTSVGLGRVIVDIEGPYAVFDSVHPTFEFSSSNQASSASTSSVFTNPFPYQTDSSTLNFYDDVSIFGSAPGAVVDLDVSIGGHDLGSVAVTAPFNPLFSIEGDLKDSILYQDSKIATMVIQLKDIEGHTQVSPSGKLYLRLNCSYCPSNSVLYFKCGNVDAISGVAVCSGVVPDDWFSVVDQQITSTVVDLSSGVKTSDRPVTLKHIITCEEPSTVLNTVGGVLGELPMSPQFPGSIIPFALSGDTSISGDAIIDWQVVVKYDASLLKFISWETDSHYDDAILQQTDGQLVFTSSARADIDITDITGSHIPLVTGYFLLNSSAPTGVIDVVSVQVNYLHNTLNSDIGSHETGLVKDYRDEGPYQIGQILVKKRSLIGAFAYADNSDIINTSPLDGLPVFSQVYTSAYSNDPRDTSFVNTTSISTCSYVNTGLGNLTVSKCGVKVTESFHTGSSQVQIGVSIPRDNATALSTAMTYRIWCINKLEVSVFDKILNALSFS